MYGFILLIIIEISTLASVFLLLKRSTKYLHAASINLARIPVLPFGVYISDFIPTLLLLMFCMMAAYPITSSLDAGIKSDDWFTAAGFLVLGVVIFTACRIWIDKYDASQCYWLRIEDSNILGLTKKEAVLFTVPTNSVKALKLCWISRIHSYGKWSSKVKELFIVLLLHEKVYIPKDLGYYKTAEAFADRYMLIIHAPETLRLLQEAFDVPLIDESQN